MLKQLFNIKTLISFLAGICLTIVLDLLTGIVSNSTPTVQLIIVVLAILLSFLSFWLNQRTQSINTKFQPPKTRRTPIERMTNARRGLIAFVSLYRPIDESCQGHRLSPSARLKAASVGDYAQLDFEKSNFATIITSINSHAIKLEHCWLISTTGTHQPGSEPYAAALVSYLQEQKGFKECQFHYGPSYSISLDDDALVATKTHEKVNAIFEEGAAFGLANREIVADFSGCPRSMTLGMFAACVDGKRTLQFAGTRYDANNQPTGEIFPIVYEFEPQLESTEAT